MKIWNGSNQLQSLQSLHNRAAGQILLSGALQQQDRIAAVVRITLLSYTNSPDNPFLKTVFNYSLLKMCPAKGKIICHYQQIRKKPGYFLPPFPPPDPLLYCPSNEDHLLSPQATPVSIRKFFCSSFPSLQVCSSTEFITWWPNGARGSPWSWQASHDGVYDGGGQLGFSVWVKEQSRAEQLVSLQQELPSPSRQDCSPKSFGACCWPRSDSASGCKTWALGAIALCSLRAQAASLRPARLLIPPLITPEKSFLSKNWCSCTPI